MNLAVMDINIDRMKQNVINGAKDGVTYFLTAVAKTSLGQFVLSKVDWVLRLVEKSAEYSLPQPETSAIEENGKTTQPLEPTPPANWVFFLATLAALRAFRLSWDIAAFFIGYPSIDPSDIVRVVQMNRKRLNAIQAKGMKNMGQNNREVAPRMDENFREVKRSLIESIQLTLSSLSCLDTSRSSPSPPPTRIKVTANHEMCLTVEEKSSPADSNSVSQAADSKRKYAQIISSDQESDESEDESLNEKIDRMAGEDSADDQDFNPNNCTSSSGVEDEDEIEEGDVSEEELEQLQADIQRNSQIIESIAYSQEFLDDQKNSSSFSSKPIDIKPRNDTEEQRDYYSPNEYKSGDDGDADFYSPVSSKSTSPERAILTQINDGQGKLKGNEQEVERNCTEGGERILKKSNGHGETQPAQPSTSPKRTQKQHQPKGKRMTQGNRKKK